VLLSFLKIRVIVNGKDIYPLTSNKPVVITVDRNNPKIVVTDGFHFTKPLELVYHHLNTYYFKVVCAIGDFQLIAGLFFLTFFYLIGFYSGLFVVKLLSFLPLLYILFLYYINRKEFLQLTAV
jgi:hypothetical protein